MVISKTLNFLGHYLIEQDLQYQTKNSSLHPNLKSFKLKFVIFPTNNLWPLACFSLYCLSPISYVNKVSPTLKETLFLPNY